MREQAESSVVVLGMHILHILHRGCRKARPAQLVCSEYSTPEVHRAQRPLPPAGPEPLPATLAHLPPTLGGGGAGRRRLVPLCWPPWQYWCGWLEPHAWPPCTAPARLTAPADSMYMMWREVHSFHCYLGHWQSVWATGVSDADQSQTLTDQIRPPER